jgi:hypothetical protein
VSGRLGIPVMKQRGDRSWWPAFALLPALLLGFATGCDNKDNDWNEFAPEQKIMTVATDTLRLAEGGITRTLTVTLLMVPDDTVRVDIEAVGGQAVAEPSVLVFPPVDDEWARARTATISAVDDLLQEGEQVDALTVLANSRDDAFDGQGGVGLVPLVIADNDNAGVIVSETDLHLIESAEGILEQKYHLCLTSEPTASVTITITPSPADPTFHIVPSVVTFTTANWDQEQVIRLWSDLDQVDADDLTITISHSAASSDPLYGPGLAIADVIATVYNNTQPPVATLRPVALGGLALAEAAVATTADFQIVLSHASSLPVQLHLTTVDGTATGGADYVAMDQDVTFQPGDPLTRLVHLTVIDDDDLEDPESFEVVLTGLANALIGAEDRLSCTVADDDQTTLSLVVTPATEDAGSAQFVVSIPHAEPIPVTFTFTTTAGTATSGADYTAVGTPFFIAAGQTQRIIPVVLLADPYYEGDETFTANLSQVSANAHWAGTPVSCTIVDDDPQSIALDGVTVGEAGGTAVFTLRLQAPYNVPVTLAVSTLAGDGLGSATGQEDAAAGTDYTAATGATWTIPADATTATFPVSLLAGTQAEAFNEYFRLRIDSGSRSGFAGLVATATVVDDDQPLLAVADVAVNETATQAVFTVRLVNALGAAITSTGDVTFRADTVDQTASSATDYTAVGQVFTIAAGQGSVNVPVTLHDDAWDDDSETFVLHLSAATNAAISPTEADAFCAITDDEFPSINLGAVLARANEGSTITFTVSLTTQRQSPTTYSLTLLPGTSQGAGVDYSFAQNGAQVIPAFTSSVSFTVPLLDDQLTGEIDEILHASIAGANVALGVTGLDLTIVDAPRLSIAAAPTVLEGQNAVFPVTLTAASTAPITFRVQYSSATANVLSDINGAGTGPFTIAAGATTVNVSVPTIAGDGGDNASEAFTTTLITPTNATLSGFNSATGTITDGDPSPLSFTGPASATEGTDIAFTVHLAWTSEAAIQFFVQFANGTAAGSGIDFVSAATGPYTVPAGQSNLTINVPTIDDAGPELATENFTITITNPTNAVVGATPTATGSILDGDQPVLTITAGPAVTEGGTLSFTVTMDRQSIVPVTFNVIALDGSTQGVDDYTAPIGPWTIPAGSTTRVITVPTVQDLVHENQEIMVLRLAASPTNGVLGTPVEANGVIDDDDP